MAQNTILTADVIVKEGLALFANNTPFLRGVRRGYDKSYAVGGAAEGDTIRIKRAQRATYRTGKAASVGKYLEEYVSFARSTQIGSDIRFGSAELRQDIGTFSKEILRPAINTLAANLEATILTSAYQGTYNLVGTAGSAIATWAPLGDAQAKLDNFSAPQDGRSLILNPVARSSFINGVGGNFNPADTIRNQYVSGRMGDVAGFSAATTVNVATHTVGTYGTTTLAVNDTVAEGDAVITLDGASASAPTAKKGDVFTIAGVYAINPLNKQSTGQLMQFVVTADKTGSGNGFTDLAISPTIYASTNDPRQNVTALPLNDAVVTFVGTQTTAYKQNLAYHMDAFAFGTVDLPLYGNTDFEARDVMDGVSMRIEKVVDGINDDFLYRIDILYGFAVVNPEFSCRVIGV